MNTLNVPWNIKTHPLLERHLGNAIPSVLARLRNSSQAEKISFLVDTRDVHRELFAALTPEGCIAYAGTYRGELGSILEHRRTAIHYKNVEGLKERNPALNPAEVLAYMSKLEEFIQETFWKAAHFGQGEYFTRMSRIFGMFSKIHPYLDGNGHISRLMMVILAEHKGIAVNQKWTIHPRPYGLEMALAFEHYKNCPVILQQVLRLWFDVR